MCELFCDACLCLLAGTIRCHVCFSCFASLSYDCHFFLFILFLFRYLIVLLFLLFPADPKNLEQFLDLVHDSAAKAVFAEKSLNAFWATMYGSYPRVAVAALTLLVAFPSTYLCESAFSSMVQIKTKSRNRMIDLESDLRCAISKVEPNIEALVQAKQMQISLTRIVLHFFISQ